MKSLPLLLAAGLVAPTLSQAAIIASWDVEDKTAGTRDYLPGGNVRGIAGTMAPHANFLPHSDGGASTWSLVQSITGSGAAPAGYTNVVDNVRGNTRRLDIATFNTAYGGQDTKNSTFELFLSPDGSGGNLANGNQVIFETGGTTTGLGVVLIGSELSFGVSNGGSTTARVTLDLDSIYDAVTPDFSDFLRIRASVNAIDDFIGLEALNLGTGLSLVGIDSFVPNDWTGSDAAALFQVGGGALGGDAAGNLSGLRPDASWQNFDGQFAALNFHDAALVVPEPSQGLLFGIGTAVILLRRRRR